MKLNIVKLLIGLSCLLVISLSNAATYTYDDSGRLTSVAFDSGPPQIYGYDAAGNILSVTTPLPPGAPTEVSATAGNTQAVVSFTVPANTGGSGITGYTATCNPGGVTATNTTSPITVTSLINGIAYTCSVTAANIAGTGLASSGSNSVTPFDPAATFTVSASAGANGSISPASQTVSSGNTATLTITPDAGYSASASGCSGSMNGTTYTTGVIKADCTVSVTFNPLIQGNLVVGWNLLGNSVNAPMTVATVFGNQADVSTVWKWETNGTIAGISYPAWAFYTPQLPDGGRAYAAAKGYDFLTTVNAGEGFWVNAKTDFMINLQAGTTILSSTFSDQPNSQNDALPKGWSLISVGDFPTPRSFANTIALTQPDPVAATSIITLWAWDSVSMNWYFYAPSLDNAGTLTGYITGKNYLDFTKNGKTLDRSTGFWVNHP